MFRTGKDELLETAMRLHEVAMNDEYFIKRKLAPNVDFWYVLRVYLTSAKSLISVTGGDEIFHCVRNPTYIVDPVD